MPGTWPPHELPALTDENCEITSNVTPTYNCIAWAAGDSRRWWWPDPFWVGYWPSTAPRRVELAAFVEAYKTLGYAICDDGSLQEGFQKVVIYGRVRLDGRIEPTHAAVQLPTGKWSSKLGPFEDISHSDPNSLTGPAYGSPQIFMVRSATKPPSGDRP